MSLLPVELAHRLASPLVNALSEHASQQARREAIGLGVMLWNALVALRLGEPAAFQATLAHCRSLTETTGLKVAKQLGENASKIDAELIAAQGKPVDLGGYYHPAPVKTAKAIRPSPTLNAIVAARATGGLALSGP